MFQLESGRRNGFSDAGSDVGDWIKLIGFSVAMKNKF